MKDTRSVRTLTTVRLASLTDAADIAAIEREAADAPWSLSSIQDALRQPTTTIFLAGDPCAGHLIASCVADEGEILTLAVRTTHRRRGLACALMDACEAWWRQRDVVAAWLEVRADNTAAQALYTGRAWVPAHVRRAYYNDGCDALVMKWSPSSS